MRPRLQATGGDPSEPPRCQPGGFNPCFQNPSEAEGDTDLGSGKNGLFPAIPLSEGGKGLELLLRHTNAVSQQLRCSTDFGLSGPLLGTAAVWSGKGSGSAGPSPLQPLGCHLDLFLPRGHLPGLDGKSRRPARALPRWNALETAIGEREASQRPHSQHGGFPEPQPVRHPLQ